ncbi:MAG: thioredoxin [Christensenellales bacterium]|jgi:thioredoxin 1|nr:thioredoxin [Clostridiales bacterium]
MTLLTAENFNKEVKGSELPVFIDFYADWCGPCRMAAPIVEQLSEELKGKVKVYKVNVDAEPELAQHFGIISIPTFMLIKDNKIVSRFSGLKNKQELKNIILSS